MSVSFDISAADRVLVDKIADRVSELWCMKGSDRLAIAMDLTATHANGCPLDLQRLFDADNFNLMHDIVGIGAHLDRDTGKLLGHFRPRFTKKETL